MSGEAILPTILPEISLEAELKEGITYEESGTILPYLSLPGPIL
jgi:hypothetical protein